MNDESSAIETDVVVVGAGFGGIYALHKFRGLGFSVQGFEIADDVGGTWYWNRYPGARCDVESMDYSFSFDEALQQEWTWTERYAAQPEIQAYIAHVADRFDLRPLIQFETKVDAAIWDETAGRWTITTDHGQRYSARFVILATGSLSTPKEPDIAGLSDFAGEVLFTSNWPKNSVTIAGKRVGVIGTGSSAIQAIPLLAGEAEHLTVFQRTPNFSMPARNRPLTPDQLSKVKSDYAEHRRKTRASRAGVIAYGTEKSAHEVGDEARTACFEEAWNRGGSGFPSTFTDIMRDPAANDYAAQFVRGKIAELVSDPETAEILSPRDYPLGAKRVALDTNYYQTFNKANVTVKDLRKNPLRRIVAAGVETSDGVTPLDTLVLATGFDAMTGSFLRVGLRGVEGKTLREHWSAGPRTYLGLMAHGFPNLFLVAGPGSPSVLSNMVLSIEQHVEWIADCILSLQCQGKHRIEAEAEAEEGWVSRLNNIASGTLFMKGNSWYLGANVPGKPRVFMPFLGGISEYRRLCDEAVSNNYKGFARS